jgi:hypothetical protein
VPPSAHRSIAPSAIDILPFEAKIKRPTRTIERNHAIKAEVTFCVRGLISTIAGESLHAPVCTGEAGQETLAGVMKARTRRKKKSRHWSLALAVLAGCKHGLINRNVSVAGRRTSCRLDAATWAALADVAQRERVSPPVRARASSTRAADQV